MNAMETVKAYLNAIHGGDWHTHLAEDFAFGNNTLSETSDRNSYIVGAGQFFGATTSVDIVSAIQNGNHIALVTRYATQALDGRTGSLDVAEFITVTDRELTSNAIVFDSAAFAAFMRGEV